ncbi:MAG: CvpA family protein [bacterium]|nr:MAG: membrane protein required for colicin V production [bacterium F082]KWW28736.1 MAG: membrane protein required for colicin V production [bacterium P201]MDO5315932.1 CvpA family protein [bacterium]
MNYLDIIIAIILLLFGVKGFRKGLIIEVVTLLAFAVGIYGAMHFSDFTAEHLKEFMEINPKYLNTTAFVLTFILLVILVNIIGRMVTKLIQAMNLGFFNKLGGAVFGMAKGVLLCSIMVMVLNNFQLLGVVKPEVREQSKLYPYIEETVPYVYRGFDLVKGYVNDLQNEEEEPSQAPLQTV